jgi:hypothetical protein
MKNIDLMESQAALSKRPHLFIPVKPEIKSEPPEFQATNIPFLANVPETAMTKLMGKAKTLRFLRKEIFESEGSRADMVSVIFSGDVQIVCGDEWKYKEINFQIPETRAGSGRIALLTDEMRSVSVINLEKVLFAVISKWDFKEWLSRYPELKFVFL